VAVVTEGTAIRAELQRAWQRRGLGHVVNARRYGDRGWERPAGARRQRLRRGGSSAGVLRSKTHRTVSRAKPLADQFEFSDDPHGRAAAAPSIMPGIQNNHLTRNTDDGRKILTARQHQRRHVERVAVHFMTYRQRAKVAAALIDKGTQVKV